MFANMKPVLSALALASLASAHFTGPGYPRVDDNPARCREEYDFFYSPHIESESPTAVALSASKAGHKRYVLRIDQTDQADKIEGLRVWPSADGEFDEESYENGHLSDFGTKRRCLAHHEMRLTDGTESDPPAGDVIELVYETHEGEPEPTFDVIFVFGNNREYRRETVFVQG